jgi:hypothetical protein
LKLWAGQRPQPLREMKFLQGHRMKYERIYD